MFPAEAPETSLFTSVTHRVTCLFTLTGLNLNFLVAVLINLVSVVTVIDSLLMKSLVRTSCVLSTHILMWLLSGYFMCLLCIYECKTLRGAVEQRWKTIDLLLLWFHGASFFHNLQKESCSGHNVRTSLWLKVFRKIPDCCFVTTRSLSCETFLPTSDKTPHAWCVGGLST